MMDLKVKLDELKKALQWMEANTNAVDLRISDDGHKLLIEAFDRADSHVTITLYSTQAATLPKITKTDTL